MKRIISTEKAPKAVGAYSQAVEVNGTLYLSGQIALDPYSGKIVEGGIKEQTTQVMKNISAVLEVAGFDFSDVVSCTVLLSDIGNFRDMNEVYSTYYPQEQPARAAYAVRDLPLGALVEIVTVAVK